MVTKSVSIHGLLKVRSNDLLSVFTVLKTPYLEVDVAVTVTVWV